MDKPPISTKASPLYCRAFIQFSEGWRLLCKMRTSPDHCCPGNRVICAGSKRYHKWWVGWALWTAAKADAGTVALG